ncbi:hypothetical protein EI42_01040 [Thermosporothrix hazakensis]|jgi:uncharacterized alkaline shock family protein YloU|uniref:Alkaline shock family protein YloU n=1 Tax=Thermosporothrix hazakensis TaxID=644383 RepID=A0A326UFX2_THEHA|nr:alkaline shock response membrane anchor protein AmaP [Thermosporothrix hazakensis]PZW36854.1 hypothetical protein EI42_01040 [Thermosporothrix hazakensis]GCE47502.1 hypothetical protein KTH_23710 [Thermosporothrix hazakensis]
MRNVFNRIVLLILSILAIVFGILALLILGGLVSPAQLSPGGFLHGLWSSIGMSSGPGRTTALISSIVALGLGLVFLGIELLPGRRGEFVIRRDGLGTVSVARNSIDELVGRVAGSVPGVREVREDVEKGDKGLRVWVRAAVAPDVVAPDVARTLQEQVHSALQNNLGLPVSEVRVSTQLASLEHTQRKRVQ